MKPSALCAAALLTAANVAADLATLWAPGDQGFDEGVDIDIKAIGTGTNSEGAAETTYEVAAEWVDSGELDGTVWSGDKSTYAQTVTLAEGASHARLAQVQVTSVTDGAYGEMYQSVSYVQDCKGQLGGSVTCVGVEDFVYSGDEMTTSMVTSMTTTEEAAAFTTISYDPNQKADSKDDEDSGAAQIMATSGLALAGIVGTGAALFF